MTALTLCKRIHALSNLVIAAHKAVGGGFRQYPEHSFVGQALKRELDNSLDLQARVSELQLYVHYSDCTDPRL